MKNCDAVIRSSEFDVGRSMLALALPVGIGRGAETWNYADQRQTENSEPGFAQTLRRGRHRIPNAQHRTPNAQHRTPKWDQPNGRHDPAAVGYLLLAIPGVPAPGSTRQIQHAQTR